MKTSGCPPSSEALVTVREGTLRMGEVVDLSSSAVVVVLTAGERDTS